MRLVIGPPNTPFAGMNTTSRRQQLNPNEFYSLRNVKLIGEALTRINGNVRVLSGALPATSLSLSGNVADFVSVSKTLDSTALDDYDLGTNWTIFVSYTADSLTDDVMVCSDSSGAQPPWRITHGTNGKLVAIVHDDLGSAVTLTTTETYPTHAETQVQLYRDGGTVGLLVNDDTAVTGTGINATRETKSGIDALYLGSWTGRSTGSELTLYEFGIWRRTRTSRAWRETQYPNTGRFGDPTLALHLLFEDGSGASVTDYSRINNPATLNGSYTWNTTTARQTIAPVTGIKVLGKAAGRRWLIADIGKNHYRMPL